jgi:hypothetical protein
VSAEISALLITPNTNMANPMIMPTRDAISMNYTFHFLILGIRLKRTKLDLFTLLIDFTRFFASCLLTF